MSPDLLHPSSAADVAEMLAASSADGRRVLIVGGRRHLDKGNPAEVDVELWTTQLDQVVAHDPAEMLVVVQAGMRCGALAELLAEHGQEWPADAPANATVGGVIASGSSSARRMRVGAIRDTVVEMELVTGDGRIVHSGARTVKNVTGYDVHRLATGSLGTLGVITRVALKVRPVPERRVTIEAHGSVPLATEIARRAPLAAGVLATAEAVEVRLEGWHAEVEELTTAVAAVAPSAESRDDLPFPSRPWWEWPDVGTVVEASVAPSRLAQAVGGSTTFAALAGVGLAWIATSSAEELTEVRARIATAGGIAPAIRGSGGLGGPPPPGLEVHRRLRAAFDPARILTPGRGWHGPP